MESRRRCQRRHDGLMNLMSEGDGDDEVILHDELSPCCSALMRVMGRLVVVKSGDGVFVVLPSGPDEVVPSVEGEELILEQGGYGEL